MTAAALLLAASSASAQMTHPSFAGTWVLDVGKSQSTQALPDSATWTISQTGDTVVMDRVNFSAATGNVTIHGRFATDGKEWKNTITQPAIGEIQTATTAAWDGAALVATTGFTVQDTPVIQTDRWTLSADGKTLTSDRKFTADGQDVATSTLVFSKKN